MVWKQVSYVLGSPTSRKILECLDKKSPLAPLQISKECDIARSNVSTKLHGLKKNNLVEVVNPEARKWRFYKITAEGRKVLKEVGKVKK